MERLTGWDYIAGVKTGDILNGVHEQVAFDRLAAIEDILGDTYDLDRLRDLVEADLDGRCVMLPVKPGEIVRFARNPRAKQERVDSVTIYEDGRITFGFHEYGMKETFVDEWVEDDAENYVPVSRPEAALAAQIHADAILDAIEARGSEGDNDEQTP